MIYVFDTSSFIVLGHYFPNQFPTFWKYFSEAVDAGKIVSTREVAKELEHDVTREHLQQWIKANRAIFQTPTPEETLFVSKIFSVRHFQQLINERQRLKGTPVADPFVIAAAKIRHGCVVTEETFKENAARIPNICMHFQIPCVNLENFMLQQNWTF